MKIREIVVKDFMKWRKSWRIDGFSDGVCKLVEDNEYGKSTILAALKGIIQYRHGSSVAQKNFRPTGDKVNPEVTVVFDVGGKEIKIWKKFAGQSGRALLEMDGKRFEDDAAEEELEKILGLKSAARGVGQAGVWGALWLDQTQSVLAPSLDEAARDTINGAIVSQVGHVTGGDRGVRILEKVKREVSDIKGDRGPKGKYRTLIDEVTACEARLAEAQVTTRSVEQDVSRLNRVIEALENRQEAEALDQMTADLAKAGLDLTAERMRAGEVATVRRMASEASMEFDRAVQTLERCRELQERLRRATERVDGAEAELADATENLSLTQMESEKAVGNLGALEERVRLGEKGVSRAEAVLSMVLLATDVRSAEESLAKAQAIADEISTVAVAIEQSLATDDVMNQVRDLERKAQAAEIRLVAGAPEIDIDAEPLSGINVNGAAFAGSDKKVVIDQMLVTGPGFSIRIRPPAGADREKLKSALVECRSKYDAALARVGAATLDDLIVAVARRRDLVARFEVLQEKLKLAAPGSAEANIRPGVDGLIVYLEARRRRLMDMAVEQGMPTDTLSGLPTVADAANARTMAQNELASAKKAFDAVIARNIEIEARRRAAMERATRSETLRQEARQARDAEGAALSLLLDGSDEAALVARVEDARAKREAALAASAAVEDTDVAGLEAKVDRLRRSIEESAKAKGAMREERIRLEASLGERRGAGEKQEEIAAELSELKRRLAAMEEDLGVAEVLLEALRSAEMEAKDRYVAPVKRRVVGALKSLLPSAEVEMNEDMGIDVVRRGGIEEVLEILSTGMREQLAVLVRLAFAEILIENRLPAMLILDDALVYSDDRRMDAMVSILDEAARRMQIVVLTCHGLAWRRLPGSSIRVTSID